MHFSENTDPLTYSAFCQGELRGTIQFTALLTLLPAKRTLPLINMDLVHTNCFREYFGKSPSFPQNVERVMCVYS